MTWQISTAYRARSGQSRKRRRRGRQDRRIFESVVSRVQTEILREWRDVFGLPVTEEMLGSMMPAARRAIECVRPGAKMWTWTKVTT